MPETVTCAKLVAFINGGGNFSIAPIVNVKPERSPIAAPLTIVPPFTSAPFCKPTKNLFPL